jgi:endonuclease YncB( thermonuclease family)
MTEYGDEERGSRGQEGLCTPFYALVLLTVGAFVLSDHKAALSSEMTINGVPRIVDGDTVQIGATKIRLVGIDAPETDQLCLDKNGERWPCGVSARDELIRHAGSQPWSCLVTGKDRYGRSLAKCESSGEDIEKWMVRNGWALSFVRYSHVYDREEEEARAAKAGLWAGAFIAPWNWRGRNRRTAILGAVSVPTNAQATLLSSASAAEAPSPGCEIKGNANRRGECIYHLPGTRHYSSVKMNLSKGKRWFCSSAEAEAAGCRALLKGMHMFRNGVLDDICLAAVQDSARVPDPGLQRD